MVSRAESWALEATIWSCVYLQPTTCHSTLLVDPQYAVRFHHEKVYHRKQWTLDLDPTRTGKTAPGTYRRSMAAAIDPLWPSSFDREAPNGTRMCWIRYHFHTKLHSNTGKMGDRVVLEKSFEVWVLNSLDPSPMPSPSLQFLHQKITTKKSGLIISLSIPSEGRVEIGQVLPITLQVPPFEKSKYHGQAPILTECVLKLREEAVGRTKAAWGYTFRKPKDLYTLPLQTDDWPRDGYSGLERVISMSLPGYPAMSTSAKTKWLEVTYILEISLKIRAEGQKERDAEVVKAQCKNISTSQE